jgi:hypothetical protein
VIRLGSLGGYPFEGPRVLAGWSPPAVPGVFAVLYAPDAARPQRQAVIYVGHADDLAEEGFPFRHPASPCWLRRAGSKYGLSVAWYEVPGGTARHREQIVAELAAVYRPGCNEQQFDQAWKDEWIGTYSAPTQAPLTTDRDPSA